MLLSMAHQTRGNMKIPTKPTFTHNPQKLIANYENNNNNPKHFKVD
jgi:hypothetical protein